MKALLFTLVSVCAFAAAPVQPCDALARVKFGNDVTVTSAKLAAATENLPEHCDVRGVIWPEAKFAVKLPTAWNQRFQMEGGGGWAGNLSLGPMDEAVRKGYATTSTDTGHDAQKEPGAIFAYPSAANPNAARKL